MGPRQQALTVVAPVRAEVRAGLSGALTALEPRVREALERVRTMHFGRFVLLAGKDGPASRLAFESNHDGDRDAHLAELARELAPFEDDLFGACEGYTRGDFARFAAAHALPAATYYLGHPGLGVDVVLNDAKVRDALGTILDGAERDGKVAGKTAREIRALLLEELGDGLTLGPVDRGLPAQPWATLWFYGVVTVGVVLLAVAALPIALLVERRERATEAPRQLLAEDDPRLDAITLREDAFALNGFTHHVPLRPGLFRKAALSAVLWFLDEARRNIAYTGTLGGISSIHFARWVVLDDDTVLFFSNYDGSWESYLGDFVDKAHAYLSAVWTNTKWFPDTTALIKGGASRESLFKRWTRTFQVENQIWYSAYPHLTVTNVLNNAAVREGAAGDLDEDAARAWLARL